MSKAGVGVCGVYVYGVVPGSQDASTAVRGVAGAHVRAVCEDGLVALVSPLGEPALTAADVRAHWRVLEDAFARGTVLPFRFGTVFASDADVRERLLDANRERLSQLLREMDGLVQCNVRGVYDEEALLRDIVASSPAVATLRERLRATPHSTVHMPQQVQLGQLVDTEIAARRAEDTDFAMAELEPLAAAARSDEVRHPDAFKLAFLVERDREQTLGEGVARIRARLGERITIEFVGPLPPLSFADAELAAGDGVWA
jgi:hypothetical protein